MRYLRLLRRRDFGLLWAGATLSLLGDGLTWVALVWLLFELGGSAVDVGWLVAAYTGPVIVGGIVAGIVLDRFDRRRALIVENAVRGLAVASIPVAAALGVLGAAQLFVVAAIYGALYMVSLAGIPSLIPSLVADEDLPTANALETLSFAVGGILGPALGGVLIALVGAAQVLALDALSYLVFVACLAFVRVPGRAPLAVEPGAATEVRDPARATAGSGLGPAIRFVLGQPAIVAITILFMSFNVGEGILTVVLPTLARDVLAVGAEGYGWLAATFTAGMLAGAVLVGAVRWPFPLGRSIAAAQTLAGLVLVLLVPMVGERVPVGVAAVLAVAGFLASPLTIWAQTIRMRLIPEELRGRVFALLRTLMQSTPPAGGILGGALLASGSLELAVVAMAALAAVPGLVGLLHPALGAGGERAVRPTGRATGEAAGPG